MKPFVVLLHGLARGLGSMAGLGAFLRKQGYDTWSHTYPSRRHSIQYLADALTDQRESLRRLLTPGDAAAISRVVGTDGRELDLERRVRLLSHGILLERAGSDGPLLEAHPLVPLAA